MSSEFNRWKIEKIALKDVNPYERNPRSITDKAKSGLRASMERFGYVEPIVWNRTTGNIVGGHQRFEELKRQGVKKATMVVVEMKPDRELAANLTLNNPEIEGDWDEPALALLEQVKDADEELYKALNMDGLQESIESMISSGDSDDGDDEEEETDTKCPCCNFEWKIGASDVSIDGLEEEESHEDTVS